MLKVTETGGAIMVFESPDENTVHNSYYDDDPSQVAQDLKVCQELDLYAKKNGHRSSKSKKEAKD